MCCVVVEDVSTVVSQAAEGSGTTLDEGLTGVGKAGRELDAGREASGGSGKGNDDPWLLFCFYEKTQDE